MDNTRQLLCAELTVHFVRLFYIDGHPLSVIWNSEVVAVQVFSNVVMEMQSGLR